MVMDGGGEVPESAPEGRAQIYKPVTEALKVKAQV